MKWIRKRRNGYAVLFVISILLTAWFVMTLVIEKAVVFGAVSIALLMLLVEQNNLLYNASLIWDNRILVVPMAIISKSGDRGEKDTEEIEGIVISTFGILIGSKIYKWGCDGVRGVRLNKIKIDRTRIYLTFGDKVKTMRAELLHGMTNEQVVMDVKQKLWRETGITVVINGW